MANFLLQDDPLCILTPMANQTAGAEKSWCWSANDFCEEEEGRVEKLAVRFNKYDDSKLFFDGWAAAKAFNAKAKEEGVKDEDLVWADTVDDIAEVRVDDIDTN